MRRLGMTIRVMLASLGLAGLSLSAPAAATTIQVSHMLDPANISESIYQEPLSSPFTAGVGDHVEYDLSFVGGPLTLTGDTYLWLLSLTDPIAGITTGYTWEFLNPSANLIAGPISGSQDNQQVHVGTYLLSDQYRLDNAPISFSGIRLSINLLSLYDVDTDDDGVPDTVSTDPRSYYSIALATDGRAGAVPEPATWLMLIAGVGVVGGALRTRRKPVSAPVVRA